MKFYFPTLAKSVDVAAEAKRDAAIPFAAAPGSALGVTGAGGSERKEEMLQREVNN